MAQVNETIKRFWNKHIVAFYPYVPARFKNVSEDIKQYRELVYSFKSGERYEEVAQLTADKVTEIVFTCIPASSAEKNELRYKKFSERVCELSDAVNGYEHLKVAADKKAIHESREKRSKQTDIMQNIDIDGEWFRNRSVVTMDDCLTSGKSWTALGSKLEEFGAEILAGYFLSKTTYKLQ